MDKNRRALKQWAITSEFLIFVLKSHIQIHRNRAHLVQLKILAVFSLFKKKKRFFCLSKRQSSFITLSTLIIFIDLRIVHSFFSNSQTHYELHKCARCIHSHSHTRAGLKWLTQNLDLHMPIASKNP